MTSAALFTLGTRGSPLALMQANETRLRLAEAHGWEVERIALQVIRTTGDRIQDRPLAEAGGKGLFIKEIDVALLAGTIDAAAHSAKDLPSIMPDGVVIAAYLPREDVRDALISALADSVEGLPRGRRSAPPRFAVRPRLCDFAPTSSRCSCAAMSRRG
jgi:hydroxymethylbilane synthase